MLVKCPIGFATMRLSSQPLSQSFWRCDKGLCDFELFVEGKVIVELKATKANAPERQPQIINTLMETGIEVGLLIHFGNPKLATKRFTRHELIYQRIEIILYILFIHVHSFCSKSYACVLSSQEGARQSRNR